MNQDIVKIRITERPKTVTVTLCGVTHTGKWNDNEEVKNVVGDVNLLKAALSAWGHETPVQNTFELTEDRLSELSGGWW